MSIFRHGRLGLLRNYLRRQRSGALTLGLHGIIYWAWLPALVAGSLLGGYVGAHWSIVKGNRWIKRAYELVTFLVGVMLLLGRARLFG